MEKYKLELIIDGKKAEVTLQNVADDLKKLKKDAGTPTKVKVDGKDAVARLRDLTVAAQGVRMAYMAVNRVVSTVYQSYRAQEEADRKLQNTLKATGNQLGLVSEDFKSLAARIQATTGLGDEVISNEVISNFLTFKSINLPDVFDRATKAAMDLSAQFGQDLKSSTIQLGKALEDPVKGVSALARVGVTFTETEKEMIKSLVEANKKADAQRMILAALEGQTQGAAEAMADPVKMLSSNWSDLVEILGESFVPILNNIVPKMTQMFSMIHDWSQESNVYMKDAFAISELWGSSSIDSIEQQIAVTQRNVDKLQEKSRATMADMSISNDAAVAIVNDNALRREALEKEIEVLNKLKATKQQNLSVEQAENAKRQQLKQAKIEADVALTELEKELSAAIDKEYAKEEIEREEAAQAEKEKLKNEEIETEKQRYIEKLELLRTQKDVGLATAEELKQAQFEYLRFVKQTYGDQSKEYALALSDMKVANMSWGKSVRQEWRDEFNRLYEEDYNNSAMSQFKKKEAYISYLNEVLAQEIMSTDRRLALEDEIATKQKQVNADRKKLYLSGSKAILNAGSRLMSAYQEQSKTMFNIGKALAYANATMNTAEGVTKAIAAYPPPISIGMAAIQSAIGVAEIATISEQKFKAAMGGYLVGPPHSAGGINLEAEGGEYIMRKSVVDIYGKDYFDALNYGAPVSRKAISTTASYPVQDNTDLINEIRSLKQVMNDKQFSAEVYIDPNKIVEEADPSKVHYASEQGARSRKLG